MCVISEHLKIFGVAREQDRGFWVCRVFWKSVHGRYAVVILQHEEPGCIVIFVWVGSKDLYEQ
jgi:hypothetical protein